MLQLLSTLDIHNELRKKNLQIETIKSILAHSKPEMLQRRSRQTLVHKKTNMPLLSILYIGFPYWLLFVQGKSINFITTKAQKKSKIHLKLHTVGCYTCSRSVPCKYIVETWKQHRGTHHQLIDKFIPKFH